MVVQASGFFFTDLCIRSRPFTTATPFFNVFLWLRSSRQDFLLLALALLRRRQAL